MKNRFQINFFYILLIAVAAAVFFIFLPYFKSLFVALILAVLFYPLYQFILRLFQDRKNLAAFVTTILILVVLVIPIITTGIMIFDEARESYVSFIYSQNDTKNVIYSLSGKVQVWVDKILPGQSTPETTMNNLEDYASKIYGWLINNLRSAFSSALSIAFDLLIVIFAVFFFLRDGEKIRKILIALSPLSDTYDESIIDKMKFSINSVVRGSILIAVIQGALSGIGFALFQVPSPVLWGTVSVLAAFIPSVGTAIVLIPIVIFVFYTKGLVFAIGLLLWGGLIVGLVDNLLRPILLERGIKIHPFLILLSVFGGIGVFGPIGFLLGPIVLSLLFTLIDIFPLVRKHFGDESQSVKAN